MNNHKIIFTTHALDRLEEAGVTPAEAKEYLNYAEKEKKSGQLKEYKDRKYGKGGQDEAGLYTFGLHLFTVIKKEQHGEKIALVITYSYRPNNNWFGKPNGRKRHNNY